jgi:protein-disulfide isomerase
MVKMEKTIANKFFSIAFFLISCFLFFGCVEQRFEEKAKNITETLTTIAEISNADKPELLEAKKVELIRLVYLWKGNEIVIYTDESFTKLIGLTPGKEEDIRKVKKDIETFKEFMKNQFILATEETKLNVVLEEPKNAAFKGDENAKVIILKFSDFQCKACKDFLKIEKQIEEKYVKNGLAKIYYVHLPLSKNVESYNAANAAECAKEQGMFWQYHNSLFANQNFLGYELYKKIAAELAIDVEKWDQCYKEKRYKDLIEAHIKLADSFYVDRLPSIVIFNKNGLSNVQKNALKNLNVGYVKTFRRPLFFFINDINNETGLIIVDPFPIEAFDQIMEIIR